MWRYYNKFDYEIVEGTLPMYQNTTMRVNGAWIKIYCVLCSKTYNTLHSCHNFPVGSRQATRGVRICETILISIPNVFHVCFWVEFTGALYSDSHHLVAYVRLECSLMYTTKGVHQYAKRANLKNYMLHYPEFHCVYRSEAKDSYQTKQRDTGIIIMIYRTFEGIWSTLCNIWIVQ